jgi:hypothetical protein
MLRIAWQLAILPKLGTLLQWLEQCTGVVHHNSWPWLLSALATTVT